MWRKNLRRGKNKVVDINNLGYSGIVTRIRRNKYLIQELNREIEKLEELRKDKLPESRESSRKNRIERRERKYR